jgi:toxin-antitoxin system PIN domain toxin
MTSFDTNVLLYAFDESSREQAVAKQILQSFSGSSEVVICELVLVELYLLLRNPVVVRKPLDAPQAATVCQSYRAHPTWRLVDAAPVMDGVWGHAGRAGFARRSIFDARLALTLRHHGVTRLITRNTKHFEGFDFESLTNPFDD